ncbi:hypothetical protein [Amorphus sp. MBR-141]
MAESVLSSTPEAKAQARREIANRLIGKAGWVLVVLTCGVFIVVTVQMWNGDSAGHGRQLAENYIFAVLPLVGTWIGTVLAFYFSNDSFQLASSEARKTASEARDAKLRQISVTEAMVPLSRIQAIEANPPNWGSAFFDTEVLGLLNKKVGRIPIIGSQAYGVIHDSVVRDYAWQNGIPPTANTKNVPLKAFLTHPSIAPIFTNSVAFVGPHATLADVKAAMEKASVSGYPCRDVFVTEDGTPTGTPLGLITNIDLEKFSSYG